MSLLGQRWRNRPPSLSDAGFTHSRRYEVYARMRNVAPVMWDPQFGCWVVTGFDATMAALKEPRLKASRLYAMAQATPEDLRARYLPLVESVSRTLLFSDEPAHPRIRSLVQKAFTPRRVEAMRDHMRELATELIDDVIDRGEMEVMQELAYPMPTKLITEMLGIPADRHEEFREWTEGLATFLGEWHSTTETMDAGLRSIVEMTEYFREAIAHIRAHPGEDLLSALAQAEEQGDMLTEDELYSTAILLLAAGHETTASLIGNALHLLLTHPDELAAVGADPSLIPAVVEEALRIESPIQLTGRLVSESFSFCGADLDAGDLVTIALGAANHDPAQFDEPDAFNIRRGKNQHLAFSHGPHYCLGSMLARAETQIALSVMLEKLPGLALVDAEPDWKDNQTLRALRTLHVRFDEQASVRRRR